MNIIIIAKILIILQKLREIGVHLGVCRLTTTALFAYRMDSSLLINIIQKILMSKSQDSIREFTLGTPFKLQSAALADASLTPGRTIEN